VGTFAAIIAAVLGGIGLMAYAGFSHRQARQQAIEELLGLMPLRPAATAGAEEVEMTALAVRAVDLAGQAVDTMDRERSLANFLERAKVRLRPGEFVIIVTGGALGLAAVLLLLTGLVPVAVAGAVMTPLLTAQILRRRVKKRRSAFEQQLPGALSLVASSLSAGHTFLRAIQMMCEESGPPMSEEFARVVAETRLGDTVTDAVERMAIRLQIRDMDMVVQAIRIQQTVGGRLADLLHTLAEVIRSRDELRREVLVLTAEGRLSAYVLAGLVPFLFLMMRVTNPSYIAPLYYGKGLAVLLACVVSTCVGLFVILRMVKIDV
jgi:tight adherence protein B